MAVYMSDDVSILINAVDLSDHVTSVTFSEIADELETTAFGQSFRSRIGGLKDGSLDVSFNNDFAASSVQATIRTLIGTVVVVVLKPTSGSLSATNPSYTFSVLVTEWPTLGNAVGELATADVSWPITTAVVEATS